MRNNLLDKAASPGRRPSSLVSTPILCRWTAFPEQIPRGIPSARRSRNLTRYFSVGFRRGGCRRSELVRASVVARERHGSIVNPRTRRSAHGARAVPVRSKFTELNLLVDYEAISVLDVVGIQCLLGPLHFLRARYDGQNLERERFRFLLKDERKPSKSSFSTPFRNPFSIQFKVRVKQEESELSRILKPMGQKTSVAIQLFRLTTWFDISLHSPTLSTVRKLLNFERRERGIETSTYSLLEK